eukprot:TRINITY_DN2925_c0_g1_i1.p1 TRINITY_DN2925_c0_g1~~TRINITY_DN2925_c0_g1_i1.p1  ORF type:complete len:601 (+),score=153.95 TRINITY_DN2925_c0_g1_i1:1315-3117(+)
MESTIQSQKDKLKPTSSTVTSELGNVYTVENLGKENEKVTPVHENVQPFQVNKNEHGTPSKTSSSVSIVKPLDIPPRVWKIEKIINSSKKITNTQSNIIVWVNNVEKSDVVVNMNQRLRKIVFTNVKSSQIHVLDSVVIGSRAVEFVNVHDTTIFFDAVDARHLSFYNCSGLEIQLSDEETLTEEYRMVWRNSSNNKVQLVLIVPGSDPNRQPVLPVNVFHSFDLPDTEDNKILMTYLEGGRVPKSVTYDPSQLSNVDEIPRNVLRTEEDLFAELEEGLVGNEIFNSLSKNKLDEMYDEELREYEESHEVLSQKVKEIAAAIKESKHLVVYTGAGVSTSADIPDYRGPEGVWTLKARGGQPSKKKKGITDAYPTYTHYALTKLQQSGLLKFIVSTNLDGLHLRSGIPIDKISELHGNGYLEICARCDKHYLRSNSVLDSREDIWSHRTGRYCSCGGYLRDTIVHFTESIRPNVWKSAVDNSRQADVCLVLGTSMCVQPAASLPMKVVSNKGKLFVVNLQRTPYDDETTVKVYSKTDYFMEMLMEELGLSEFDTEFDLVDQLYEQEQKAKESHENYLDTISWLIPSLSVGVLSLLNYFGRK